MIVGHEGTVLKTTNGGNDWSLQVEADDILSNVYPLNENIWYICGAVGVILKSTNAGTNWSSQSSGTANFITTIYFSNIATGYALGDFGTILKTTSGGLIVPVAANIKLVVEAFLNINTFVLNSRDTVTAYLASSTSPFNLIDSARAVIDSVTYTGNFLFANAPSGTYYIVIKHRNSIETWSKTGGEIYNIGNVLNYDFTSARSQAFGDNLILKSSLWCNFSGDVNHDGIIDGSDLSLTDNDAFNFLTGYLNTDINGDNFVDATDLVLIDNNAFNFIGVRRP